MTFHDLPKALLEHLGFTFVSVAVGFVLGVLLGILLSRLPKNLSKLILPILSIFNTIPGVVFVGLLFLVLGMQPITVLIALSIYATFPILKNTYAGLSSVEGQYIEAAKGCGMSPIQCLVRVELPLALPTIIGGLRMSTVYTVSWATASSFWAPFPPPSWPLCWALWWTPFSAGPCPVACGKGVGTCDLPSDL